MAAAVCPVAGGATGNVTDRILHGAVTDFFEVWFGTYRYPPSTLRFASPLAPPHPS